MAAHDRKKKVVRKKIKRMVHSGIVYISATYNNTIITITDDYGNVIIWGTAGSYGFKGARKSTLYAAQVVMEGVLKKSLEYGLQEVKVRVAGVGVGRDAIRYLGGLVKVTSIRDCTPIPHGGVKPPKRRRI